MMIAVNTKSGIQDIRSLLVFFWPAGHSFADRIVVPAGGRRNDAQCLPTPGCEGALNAVRIPGMAGDGLPSVSGDRIQSEL